ncbi:MAG: hypothetical protein E7328_01475 [Clostridiales bacterium]|nr:hypothetical protein [Clostridiales bacterium]
MQRLSVFLRTIPALQVKWEFALGKAVVFALCFCAGGAVLTNGITAMGPILLYGFFCAKRFTAPAALGGLFGAWVLRQTPPMLLVLMAIGCLIIPWVEDSPLSKKIPLRRERLLLLFAGVGAVVDATGAIAAVVLGLLDLLFTAVLGPYAARGIRQLEGYFRHAPVKGEPLPMVVLCAVVLLALCDASLLGMHLGRTAAMGVALTAGYLWGGITGAAVGLAAGGAACLMGFSPLMIGALGLCGLCAGLCRSLGVWGSWAGFFLCSAAFFLFTTGPMVLPLFEQLLMAAAITHLPLEQLRTMAEALTLAPKGEVPRKMGEDHGLKQLSAVAHAAFLGAEAVKEGSKGAMAEQMNTMAQHLSRLAREGGSTLPRVEERVKRELHKMGYGTAQIKASRDGFQRTEVILSHAGCGGRQDCIKVLSRYISRAMGQEYRLSHRPCRGDREGDCTLTFTPAPVLCAEAASLGRVKPGMDHSGDVFLMAKAGPNRAAAILCDGMGSGKAAKKESTTAAELLLAFLRAGLEGKNLVKMVNSIMAMRNCEVFSTGDVTLLDLCTRQAHILKMSAPPTFILREDKAHWVKGRSLPMGAVEEAEPFYTKQEVTAGDTIIMMSDGISDLFSDTASMGRWLLSIRDRDPAVDIMAKRILKEAAAMAKEEGDDMTVAVIRLSSIHK